MIATAVARALGALVAAGVLAGCAPRAALIVTVQGDTTVMATVQSVQVTAARPGDDATTMSQTLQVSGGTSAARLTWPFQFGITGTPNETVAINVRPSDPASTVPPVQITTRMPADGTGYIVLTLWSLPPCTADHPFRNNDGMCTGAGVTPSGGPLDAQAPPDVPADAVDAGADAVDASPTDVVDVEDAADGMDAMDVEDAADVTTMDAIDARAPMDVVDVVAPIDAPDVVDAATAVDVASDGVARDVFDAGDGGGVDASGPDVLFADVPADTGLMRFTFRSTGVHEIRAGGRFTCVLAMANSGIGTNIFCWGANDRGQLGGGAAGAPVLTPTPIASAVGSFISLAAGTNHACVADGTGQVLCWGANNDGQLGLGDTTDRPGATFVPTFHSAGGVDHVYAGGSTTCVDSGGLRHVVYCWGRNDRAQTGVDPGSSMMCLEGSGGARVPCQPTPTALDAAVASAEDSLTIGLGHVCMNPLTSDGGVVCFGDNSVFQFGTGTSSSTPTPVPQATNLGTMPPCTVLSAHGSTTCALCSASGTLYPSCWGANTDSNAGARPADSPVVRPMPVAGIAAVTAIAVGIEHACAVGPGAGGSSDIGVYCWGHNQAGQLGHDPTADSDCLPDRCNHTPTRVPGIPSSPTLHPLNLIAVGDAHSCVAMSDFTVWCWGSNSDGQLGRAIPLGSATYAPHPVAQ